MVRSSKFQTLDHLLSTVGSRKVTVRVDSDLKAESSVDLSGYNLAFYFQRNGSLNVASGKVVSGLVLANDPSWQIFTGSGSVSGLKVARPQWFGAKGDGVTDDTIGVNLALTLCNNVYFGSYSYVVKGSTSFAGRSGIKLHGDYRQAKILIDYSGTALWDFTNLLTDPYRGVEVDGLTFFPLSNTSAVPQHVINMYSLPEVKITNNRFVNCSSVAQVKLNWVYVFTISGNIFTADEVNNNQGALHPPTVGGSGVWIVSEGHNGTIRENRIRASDSQSTSAGIRYGGGDATLIVGNAIESNRNRGISFEGSSKAITISENYYEGASQPVDIYYGAAGTNYGHRIVGNFHNAVKAVQSVAENNGMVIEENQFRNMTTPVDFFGTNKPYGVTIQNNQHTDSGTQPYLFDTPTTVSDLTSSNIYVNDIFTGITAQVNTEAFTPNMTPILRNATWQNFSGTVTSPDSATYFNGIRAYDLSSSAGTSVTMITDFGGFDTSWRGKWITLFLWVKTSDGRNQTVTVSQDGGSTYQKAYTVGTSTTGKMIRIQHQVHASATALQIRYTLVNGQSTLTTIAPTVLLGMHRQPQFFDWR